ncbi:MAG: transketolase [Chthoniobacterales bacterium]
MNPPTPDIERIAAELRGEVIGLSHRAKTPHLGSSLSCLDLLTALYWEFLSIDPLNPCDPNRDRLILSKGHAAPALYAALCARGFFSRTLLDEYGRDGAALAEQPAPGCAPGVEWATGSLGHGLSAALGMALAGRIQGLTSRTVVVLSDGECNEGSVWEAAMFAAAQKLGSLTVLVDYNKWQATGRSNEVMALDPLRDKWQAFGWESYEIDGHDFPEIRAALACAEVPERDKPLAIVAHTVKGCGVSFMEDDNNWHYRIPNAEELVSARAELGLAQL